MTEQMPIGNHKVSAKEFFAFLGADISDISSFSGDGDVLFLTTYDRDEDGEIIYVGPSFARTPKATMHTIELVKPGRPTGTTIANGAAPKTRKKPTPTTTPVDGD